ncbi:MAG: hypothetical protein QOE70_4313 [Chthoniobacter sp.]|jgi:hypothetical protein|nr:hypothetical protein [Chthoniobacter sp.]
MSSFFDSARVLLLALLVISRAVAASAASPLAGRENDLRWAQPPRAIAAGVRLETAGIEASAGATIEELLKANGIQPGNDAFALVYELNPDLETLRPLPRNVRLVLPRVEGGTRESLVTIALDRRLKAELEREIAALPDLKSINGPADADLREIYDFLKYLRTIVANGILPVSRETLEQIKAEAALLRRILEKPADLANEQAKITAIRNDFEVRRSAFAESRGPEPPTRWLDARVVVRTLRDGKELPNLQIYYVPEALFGQKEAVVGQFRQLSSPAQEFLPEANYRLWAGQPDNPAPLSNAKPVEVRYRAGREPIPVDLTIRSSP